MGLFAAPNRAGIMNSLPPNRRGVGAGMTTTFQNAAMVLSIGIFFSLMITGLASSLPHTLSHGLTAQGVSAADATRVAALPPVGVLFASLLGYNPIQSLLGSHALAQLPPGHAAYLTGRSFFPHLISGPFSNGLGIAFGFAIAACVIAAIASALRGGKYHYTEPTAVAEAEAAPAASVAAGAGGVPELDPIDDEAAIELGGAVRCRANGGGGASGRGGGSSSPQTPAGSGASRVEAPRVE